MKPEVAFGQILKRYRKKAGLSQEKLAAESELDRTYISLLERGLRQPSLTTILLLSEPLQISPCELVASVSEILNKNRNGD